MNKLNFKHFKYCIGDIPFTGTSIINNKVSYIYKGLLMDGKQSYDNITTTLK